MEKQLQLTLSTQTTYIGGQSFGSLKHTQDYRFSCSKLHTGLHSAIL